MIYSLDNIQAARQKVSPRAPYIMYIDVGLGTGARHSAEWLIQSSKSGQSKNVFVLGIEPNEDCVQSLWEGPKPRNTNYLNLGEKCIYNNEEKIAEIEEGSYALLKCAVDDVEGTKEKIFYHTDEINIGCSSLLEPTDKIEASIKGTSMVTVASLQTILQTYGLPAGTIIALLKVDAQGKDLQIVKSLGKYLNDVMCIACEWPRPDQYNECHDTQLDTIEYMWNNEFVCITGENGNDGYFFNTRFMKEFNRDYIYSFFFTHFPHDLSLRIAQEESKE